MPALKADLAELDEDSEEHRHLAQRIDEEQRERSGEFNGLRRRVIAAVEENPAFDDDDVRLLDGPWAMSRADGSAMLEMTYQLELPPDWAMAKVPWFTRPQPVE